MTCWAGWSTVGIKIDRRNISNYADDTILMAESEEELKRFLMKVKEESQKAGLKLNIQKAKFMVSATITSWQIDGKTMETVTNFLFLDSQITADGDCSHEIKRCLLLGRKAMTNLDSVFSSVQFSSVTQSCLTLSTPWISARQASLSITNSRSLLKLIPIESVMPSSHLILCCPLLLLPPIPLSIRVFSNESTLSMRWPKYWSFSFSISPSNEHPGLIFRMYWLDLLAVQGTLKNLLQHHSSKASIFQCSAFLTVQLSHPHMTTEKTIALTRWTFVGKVMSLLFNVLPRLVITFLPRRKRLLIPWLQSPSAVILEPQKNKVRHCFHCLPIYFPWSDGTRS